MQNIHVNFCVVYFLLVFLRGCNCQNVFCKPARQDYPKKQVLAICTEQVSTEDALVLIDTYKVSRSEERICECFIEPFDNEVLFNFTFYNSNRVTGMTFEINDIVLNAIVENDSTFLMDKTSLKMSTSSNFKNGGACLIVSSETRFKITCEQVETNSSITTTQGHIGKSETGNVIIPSILASLCAVCLFFAVPVCISCRRKYKNKYLTSFTSAAGPRGEQRDHHDAENPVFDISETQSRVSSTEHDYNYIDHIPFGGNQYSTLSEHHYDIITDQNSRSNICRKGEIDLYDKASDNVGLGKQEADDYHHLRMANTKKVMGSTKKANVNEYNTVDIDKQSTESAVLERY